MGALFATTDMPPPPPRECAKRHRTRDEDDSQARKKELHELEDARRASLIDEEAHQLRVIEVAARASSSSVVEAERSTTDGADIDKDTTDGVPTFEGVHFEKPDPQTYLSATFCASGLLHLPLCLIYFYALGTIACFFGGGVNRK